MNKNNTYKVLTTCRQCVGNVLLWSIILFAVVYASHAQAVITLRGAAQNGIAAAVPQGITYIGAGGSQGFTSGGACNDNITPSIPAGNVGDLLIALVISKESDAGESVITMAGWTPYDSAFVYPGPVGNNNEIQGHIFYRFALGGDPNTINQQGTNCSSFGGQISRFRNVDATSPFETVSAGVVAQDSDNIDTGLITTTSSAAMLLVAGFVSDNRNVAQGAGWSQSFDFTYNDGGAKPDFGVTLNYQAQLGAGPKSISNWDIGGNDENIGAIFALTPATPPPGGGLSINVPAGTTTDDVMIAAIAVRPSTVPIIPPAGWTSLSRLNQAGGATNAQEIFYRVATAAEPASYEWHFATAITGAAGGIVAYSGTDPAGPINVFGGNTTPNGTNHQANSVTTTQANTMVISTHSFSSAMPWTPPAGMLENVDIASIATPNAVGISLEMNEVPQPVAGATGNKTASVTGNADTGIAHIVVLQETFIPPPPFLLGSCDDFESGFGNWTTTDISRSGINTLTTLSLDNHLYTRHGPVTTTSAGIDLTSLQVSSGAGQLDIEITRGADNFFGAGAANTNSEDPDGNEDLEVGYIDSGGGFVMLESFPGGGAAGEILSRSYVLSGASALHSSFQVWVRQLAGNGADFDYWHIDDVCVYDARTAYYAMDKIAWVGAGSVLDGSGNGNHASPIGGAIPADPDTNPAIAGDPGTCGYGDIPDNTDDSIDAIDTNVTPGARGSITFWYNNKSDWDTNGDRLLFDASNDLGNEGADKHFFLVRRDNNNGSLRFVVEDSSDRRFQATATNQTFAANTWVHIAVTWDLPNDIVEIYVNGVSEDTDTAGSNGIMGNINDLYIGDNRTTGVANNSWNNFSANGYIDEFTIYGAAISAAQVAADMAAIHPCTTTDHFDINHDTTAVNCQAEPITIEAHLADHTIDTAYTGTLNLSTSTVNGDWTVITGLGPLVNGAANDGLATYDMVAGDNGVVELGLKDTTVETLSINVTDGSITELTGAALASEDQNLDFAESGFTFLAGGVASAIGTQIGGKDSNVAPGSQVLELQAIRTSDITGACEAALQGVNQIELAFECRNPVTCTANQVNIDGGTPTNIAGNPLAAVATYTTVDLDFGNAADTTASFVMNYPDVGEIQLYARYDIPLDDGSSTPSGVFMLGNSNAFVERPFGFNVSVTGNPGANGPGGAQFVKAGSDFTVTTTAVLYQAGDDTNNDGVPDNHADIDPSNNTDLSDNAAALNYGQETVAESLTLSALLNQPGGGNDPGLLGTTTITGFVNGVGSTAAARYDEVGIIEIVANVTDANYLGIGAPATANLLGKSGYVGRFYPDNFVVANPTLINRVTLGCAPASNFTYMGENFQIDYDLQAWSSDPTGPDAAVMTQNYVGGFAKLDITALAGMNYGATDSATNLTARLGVASAGVFAAGVAPVQATLSLTRNATPDGMYANFEVGINPADVDGVALLPAALDLSLDGGPNTHGLLEQTDIRYGRLNTQNDFGSELLPLNMPLTTEYYLDATAEFVTNIDDSCTSITTADVLLYNNQEPKAGRVLGNTVISINGAATTTLTAVAPFANGISSLNFTAPGAEGYVDVEIQTPSYLLSDLDGIDHGIQGPGMHCDPALSGTGDPGDIAACIADGVLVDDIPSSRGSFGIFKGSDNVIYTREVY